MKTGLLALSILFRLVYSKPVFANAQDKLFRCYKPINPYDLSFEQGQEKFLNIYVNATKLVSFELYDMSGDLGVLPPNLKVPLFVADDLTSLSTSWNSGSLSMVFLGGANWGAHLVQDEAEFEFMCQELIRLETL